MMKTIPSLFWPLQILLTVMALCMIYQLVELNNQRIAMHAEIVRLVPLYQSSVQAEQKLTALAQDLIKTAETDASAAQIVKEFQIRVRPDAETEKAK